MRTNPKLSENKPTWRDYYEMTKPKVVALLLVTAVIGMYLATNPAVDPWVPLDVLILATIGIGFAASGAAVVNHVVDARIDAIMARTDSRPIPTGKIPPAKAIAFAIILSVLSMVILGVFINWLTAVLTLCGLVGYALIYTMYLKRATPQNIVIGGVSGAIPPLLGWTAVTNSVDPFGLLLVLIIYTWTPPHFWALAIHRRDDYAKANIPMLPVTHGIDFTKTATLLYTVLLVLTTILPYLTGMSGIIYLGGALFLGLGFLYHAWELKFNPKPNSAMKTFGFSIAYLLALFVVLLVDHYIFISPLILH
ncbi:MAG: protoheme IX farnesyltransferase [Gammaproteobacteria bacterium CG22_combo_CG10-13_8_21_14_all_40_8]|nr:MAG: protoheme IX farnesyltransferase [Gammaproteobacteria bacterium CG22_combo_CG10-13_8_21_14_all_40_8]